MIERSLLGGCFFEPLNVDGIWLIFKFRATCVSEEEEASGCETAESKLMTAVWEFQCEFLVDEVGSKLCRFGRNFLAYAAMGF